MPARERATATHFESVKARLAERERSDGELLQGFLDHRQEAAFAVFVARHAGKVFEVCQRVTTHHHDAEDAVQITILELMRKADSLREGGDIGCWLRCTALNISRNVRRGKTRRQKHERPREEPLTAQTAQMLDNCVQAEERDHIDAAISELPEQLRVPFVMRFVEGKSRREVARELNWPEGTVASRVRKAKKILRQKLELLGITP